MRKSVLVVHEEPALRRLLRVQLELHGFSVVEAPTPRLAMERLTGDPGGVSGVVCGTRLPGQTAGEFAAAVGRVAPDACVFVFTSDPPAAGMLPPGVRVFRKPDGLPGLLAAVRALAPDP
jgi:DNA-binding NtrC family response regulator